MAAPTRVLCVDDRRDVVESMRLVIDSDEKMECVGCLDSADDLASEVKRLRPDVILLDACMPGTDPFTAMRELARLCPATRTIVYSGLDDDAFVDQVLRAGGWGCISKRDEPTEMLRAIRAVIAGRVVLPPNGYQSRHDS